MLKIPSSQEIVKNYCVHAQLCFLIWGDSLPTYVVQDESDVVIEKLSKEPYYICALHPSPSLGKQCGIIEFTSRMQSPKCRTCNGTYGLLTIQKLKKTKEIEKMLKIRTSM